MFTATYPASFLPEEDGNGFHVRFPDLPEALTGGADFEDTLGQATDCLAEAIAGRIARGDEIPVPSRMKRGQHPVSVPLYLAPKLALYLALPRGRNAKHGVGQAAWSQRDGSPPNARPETQHKAREDSGCIRSPRQADRRQIRGCGVTAHEWHT